MTLLLLHLDHYIWLAKIPVNYVLHYTVPDCALYPDKYLFTFIISIIWTAIFSYIMVWMVTLIGFTIGVPDSVMGVTFLAIGTSVPDCYSSIHAARKVSIVSLPASGHGSDGRPDKKLTTASCNVLLSIYTHLCGLGDSR